MSVCVFACQQALAAAPDAERHFQVQDGIELERLYEPWGDVPISRSPDGRFLAFVTRRADLSTDANTYRLFVYAVGDLQARYDKARGTPPEPYFSVAYLTKTASEQAAISDLRWSDDGGYVLYRAQEGDAPPQLFSLDVHERKVKPLTDEPGGVWSYAASSGRLMYWTEAAQQGEEDSAAIKYPGGFVAPGSFFHEVMTGKDESTGLRRFELVSVGRSTARRDVVLRPNARAFASRIGVWLNPVSTRAIVLEPREAMPDAWLAYASSGLVLDVKNGRVRDKRDPYAGSLDGLAVVDVADASLERLAEFPTGRFVGNNTPVQAIFSGDGRRALISSILKPPDSSPDVSPAARDAAYLAVVDLQTASVEPIAPLPTGFEQQGPGLVTHVSWSADERTVSASAWSVATRAYSELAYEKTDRGWQPALRPNRAAVRGVEIANVESIDVPSRIEYRVAPAQRSKLLLDLNWHLKRGVAAGSARAIDWTDARGRKWSGGIVYPPGYDTEQRYPLVVQTRGFDSGKYLAQGPYPNAFAARALAARGMLVVQMQDAPDAIGVPDEAAIYLAGIEALIGVLDAKRMIDVDRIGIVGFSRSSYHVRYALANSKYSFAAATIADGSNLSFSFYVFNFNSPGLTRFEDRILGGPPVRANLQNWLDKSGSFSYDRIDTPLLIQVCGGPRSLPGHWEMFGMLRVLNKPVELLYFPDAGHVLVRPRQQYLSQASNVDWLSFWLMDYIDPDGAKADRYAYWQSMRKQQEETAPVGRVRRKSSQE